MLNWLIDWLLFNAIIIKNSNNTNSSIQLNKYRVQIYSIFRDNVYTCIFCLSCIVKQVGRVWKYKGVIGICKSKTNRQHNVEKKKDKQQSTKHTHKTIDRITWTPLKQGMNSCAPEAYVPAPLIVPVVLIQLETWW